MGKIRMRMRMRPTEMTPWNPTTVRSTTARSQTGQAMYLLEAVACPAVQVTLPEPTLLRLAGMSKYTSAQRARPEHYVFRGPRKCRISRYLHETFLSKTIRDHARQRRLDHRSSICANVKSKRKCTTNHKRKCQEPCLRTTPRWIMPFTL